MLVQDTSNETTLIAVPKSQETNNPPPYCSQALKNHTFPQSISPSNFLFVKQDLPISGTVVIDPSLEVHDDLLICNTKPGESIGDILGREKNLILETKAGYVSVNIWLVSGKDMVEVIDKAKRAVIDVMAHRRSPTIATRIKLVCIRLVSTPIGDSDPSSSILLRHSTMP